MVRVAIVALAAAAGLTGTASAQCANCGSPLLGGHKADCPGKKLYPFSDGCYIRKFCGPTVNPGACFGYYKTKWSRWEDACGEPEPLNPGPASFTAAPPAAGSESPMPPPMPKPEGAPAPRTPAEPKAPKAPLTPPEKPKEKKPDLSSSSARPLTLPSIPVVK